MKENSNEYTSLFDNFEYKMSKKFLDNTKETSCFPLIGSLTNIHLMCEGKEFKKGISKLGKKFLSHVTRSLDENDKILRSINCVYTKKKLFKNDKYFDCWLIEKFTGLEVSSTCIRHYDWFRCMTGINLRSPLKINYFYKYNRIYLSFAMFEDKWVHSFEDELSNIKTFYQSNDRYYGRMFMVTEGFFKYNKVENGKISYHVVALPFENIINGCYNRYMVYLIPICKIGDNIFTDPEADLTDIWEDFYIRHSNNDIKKSINDLGSTYINLFLPKITDLKSEFNMFDYTDRLENKMKKHKTYSEILTLLNINEEGTMIKGQSRLRIYNIISLPDSYVIKADVPHISFIFDMNLNKILFITQDLGE
jgi:hypothetical protein